ncbi:hypothetical protein J7L49_06535 [Candidatus Bathyarchaeota archaeon]|nr:hypothetical protein [Candidatus Bathyarchaeota archaeon]
MQVEDKFENISFHFTIEVYVESINYAQKRAAVTIWASIRNCSYPNATAITIIFDGDASAFVKCERFGFDYYWGHTYVDNWPLKGAGELYPFDSYTLRFVISRQFYFEENQILQTFYPNATFDISLSSPNIEPLVPYSKYEAARFIIRVQRNSILPILQFLLPILLCFFIIGGSSFIPRSKLGDRLRVYLSLFVFGPTFLLAIQNFLPQRSSLCIPEIFIVSVLIGTALSAFSSMIPIEKSKEKTLDLVTILCSMGALLLLYWKVLSMRISLDTIFLFLIAEIGFMSKYVMRFLHYTYLKIVKWLKTKKK